MLDGFRETLGSLQLVDGSSHGCFMVDAASGGAISMTVWETDDAMTASEEAVLF